MFGTAARNMASMLLAGSEIARIASASRAAIRVGTITRMKTRVPPSFDSLTPSVRCSRLLKRSTPAASSRLVTSPRRTLAISQPTTPITTAAKMLGRAAVNWVVMVVSGPISPSIRSAPTMAGRNSSSTSQ